MLGEKSPAAGALRTLRVSVRHVIQRLGRCRRILWSAVAAVGLGLAVPDVQATTRLSGFLLPEPNLPLLQHNSFVRDGAHNIVAVDYQYAADLSSAVQDDAQWSVVDIVMQQCFGGGFADDISAALPTYTFASASAWSEVAWNRNPAPVPRILDNFTRAWREDAAVYNGDGMLSHFDTAVAGAPIFGAPPGFPIQKEPFSPPGLGGTIEHPQYRSPDAVEGGANDSRKLANDYFAILVAWSTPNAPPNARHAWNIQRIYNTLTTVYNIPAGNIQVLYDRPAPANLPAIGPLEPGDIPGLPRVTVDANNSRDSWLGALSGQGFGNDPGQGSKLFIYNTGHGAHAITLPFLGTYEIIGGTNWKRTWTYSRINGFDTTPDLEADPPVNINAGGLADVLLYFDQPLDSSLEIWFNNVLAGTAGSLVAPSPPSVDPFVTTTTYAYGFSVSQGLLDLYPDVLIEVRGHQDFVPADPLALRAADLFGGEQEFLAVNIPEPGAILFIFVAAGFLAVGRRRRSA